MKRPTYITATRLLIWEMTLKSWEMNKCEPAALLQFRQEIEDLGLMETSSAEQVHGHYEPGFRQARTPGWRWPPPIRGIAIRYLTASPTSQQPATQSRRSWRVPRL
jgi:hypothetical protein